MFSAVFFFLISLSAKINFWLSRRSGKWSRGDKGLASSCVSDLRCRGSDLTFFSSIWSRFQETGLLNLLHVSGSQDKKKKKDIWIAVWDLKFPDHISLSYSTYSEGAGTWLQPPGKGGGSGHGWRWRGLWGRGHVQRGKPSQFGIAVDRRDCNIVIGVCLRLQFILMCFLLILSSKRKENTNSWRHHQAKDESYVHFVLFRTQKTWVTSG